ncbi:hypothetical protein [Natrinema marinum]|uniref:hypothetical protein n=1 Tax=Natrinema marinum TaxID=2961598 RepID=UPI0020C8D0A6|nr:hypothetical protein [Natrinema marinum]
MVKHTEGEPVDNRNGSLAKTALDTAMRAIQFLLVAIAVGMLLIAGISIHFPIQLALKVAGAGAIGAVLIEVIYFGQLSQ